MSQKEQPRYPGHRRLTLPQFINQKFYVPENGGREYLISTGGLVVYHEAPENGDREYIYNESSLPDNESIRTGIFRRAQGDVIPFIQHEVSVGKNATLLAECTLVGNSADQFKVRYDCFDGNIEVTRIESIIESSGTILSTKLYLPDSTHKMVIDFANDQIHYMRASRRGRGMMKQNIDFEEMYLQTNGMFTFWHDPNDGAIAWSASALYPTLRWKLKIPYKAYADEMKILSDYMDGDTWQIAAQFSPLLQLGIDLSVQLPPQGGDLLAQYA